MWFLVTHTGRRIPISALPADIGSDASSGVHLPDPSVAPRHARLLPGEATGLRLEVCEGALVEVDGWALRSADLRAGDELLVGSVAVRLENDDPEAAAPPDPPRVPRRSLDGPSVGPLSAPRDTKGGGQRVARRPVPDRGIHRANPRRGLLHADLSQLSIGTRCILGLALLALAAAIVWAAQALVLALS